MGLIEQLRDHLAFKLATTPRWRLWMVQIGKYELAVSIDLRDIWRGLYWRRETYRAYREALEQIDEVADVADPGQLRRIVRYAFENPTVPLWELYWCPVPLIVVSLRFR